MPDQDPGERQARPPATGGAGRGLDAGLREAVVDLENAGLGGDGGQSQSDGGDEFDEGFHFSFLQRFVGIGEYVSSMD